MRRAITTKGKIRGWRQNPEAIVVYVVVEAGGLFLLRFIDANADGFTV